MSRDSREIEVAYGDSSSDFDKILPSRPTTLGVVPKRLTLQTGSNTTKTVELSNNNEYAQHIYKTIAAGLSSDWLADQVDISKQGIHYVLFHFIKWLNTCDISMDNRFKLINLYESKRTNVDGVKPQSSGLKFIIPTLKSGIYSTLLDQKTILFIDELLKRTNVSVSDEVTPITLSAFFASMPWLRDVMGEEDYLKMESPKRMIDSFCITIATTLLFIIEAKKHARLLLKYPSELQTSNKAKTRLNAEYTYSRNLLVNLGSLDKNDQPADHLTRLIIADCGLFGRLDNVLSNCKSISSETNTPLRKIFGNQRGLFTVSHILAAKHWDKPSIIEQILFSWLCAVQMVQPADISKLKTYDFTIVRNEHGRPIAIQCSYYKGRSGCEHEPPVLDASSIEGMAILAYLDYAESVSSALIETTRWIIVLSSGQTSISGRLFRLWNDKALNTLIREKIVQKKSSPLFLNAYQLMLESSSENYAVWSAKNSKEIKKYKQSVVRPLPRLLFGLAAIKTSSVYARTDKYREGDLVNQNSHSNQSEKMHYLNDANKDWVNQNGRITRAVLLDIERYVYHPNLDAAIQQANEKVLRTLVITALDAGIENEKEMRINSLGQANFGRDEIKEYGIDADSIVVLDTPETVINMLHYINEAERQRDILIANALSFFERTVLPTAEWMFIVMSRMSPAAVQEGERSYKEIQECLPTLFSNELRGGITS